jgi:hypothetical protein
VISPCATNTARSSLGARVVVSVICRPSVSSKV